MFARPALVVTLWLGCSLNHLCSPIPRSTKFPFSVNATMPPYMGIEDVDSAMAGMAKVESPVSEEMRDLGKASPVQSGGVVASSISENPVAGATTAPG